VNDLCRLLNYILVSPNVKKVEKQPLFNLQGVLKVQLLLGLLCCAFAIFFINVTSTTCFDLIRPSSGRYSYIIVALYRFL
jgi:hypothetical protein